MIYVTYRSIQATVRSMQAVGQTTQAIADTVLRYAATAKVTGQSWHFLREYLLGLEDGEKIVKQIEKDADVDNDIGIGDIGYP